MRKVISEFNVGKYHVLKLDGEKPKTPFNAYRINDMAYTVVPLYDAANCIAIESSQTFVGKTVEFIQYEWLNHAKLMETLRSGERVQCMKCKQGEFVPFGALKTAHCFICNQCGIRVNID